MSQGKGEILQIFTNVYRRKHRSGTVSWMVRWKSTVTGRWIAMTGGRTKAEAQVLEGQVRQELLKGNDPTFLRATEDGKITLGYLIDRFFDHSRFLSGSKDWQAENRSRLDQWVRPTLGDRAFAELTKDEIIKFYLSMREEGVGRPTIHKTHTLLGLLGDLYVELSPDSENTVRKIRDFGKYFPKRAPEREINFLTPEELEILFEGARRSRSRLLRPLIRFLAHTGLRRSEALNFLWTDIDESSGFIHVRKSKNGDSRKVPIEPGALEAIAELDRRHPHIFTNQDGSRPHEDIFIKPLRTVAKRVGITKRIDLHTFRHSYGSNKIRMGWGLKKVSLLLGHRDISVTSEIYTHLLDGDLKVSDDFRFDREKPAENSEARDLAAAKIIADALVSALKDGNKGEAAEALKRVEDKLQAIIASAGAVDGKTERGGDLPRTGEMSRESEVTSEKGLRATPLLRGGFECVMGSEMNGMDAEIFQPESGEKPNKKGDLAEAGSPENFGRGDWIRTSDLFVPNEAR